MSLDAHLGNITIKMEENDFYKYQDRGYFWIEEGAVTGMGSRERLLGWQARFYFLMPGTRGLTVTRVFPLL